MTAKKGTGLLMVWCEVPPELEDDFNRWCNEEHLAERLSVPGVLNAARYEATSSGPKHLACYELESAAVLETEAYLKYLRDPTEWSQRVSPNVIGTTYIRNVYEMIHPSELAPEAAQDDMAAALQIGRMDIPKEIEDDWHEWYNSVYVPNYEKVPGCIRGRRYRAVSGEPRYLTVYELEHERVSQSEEWTVQQRADPRNPEMRAAMLHVSGSPGIWRKTFQL